MNYIGGKIDNLKDKLQNSINNNIYNPDDEPIPDTSIEPDLTLDNSNVNVYNTIGDDFNEFKNDILNLKHKFRVEDRSEPKTIYSTTIRNIYDFFFNRFNFILIAWFLAIFITVYGFLRIFTKTDVVTDGLLVSRVVDFITFSFMFIYIFHFYYSSSPDNKSDFLNYLAELFKTELKDFNTIFYVIFFIIFLYSCSFLLGVPIGIDKPYSFSILENKAWIFLVLLIIVDFFTYILNISIVDLVYNYFYDLWKCKVPRTTPPPTKRITPPVCYTMPPPTSPAPTTSPPTPSPAPTPDPNAEVFNISNNLYTYDDAQNVCNAMGATLATYEQIESAYNDGAEWCNYGWSDDQMAYFPTQLDTFNKMQKNNKGKINNNCGRPGINGGFMANPNLKFGVNCFGKKPLPKDADLSTMKINQNVDHPKTAEQIALAAKVAFWKKNSDKLLNISGFNNNQWSENQ